MNKIKVCHITTAHPSHDQRILYKECASLAKYGYDVVLLVPNVQDETVKGVIIKGVNIKGSGRLFRFLFSARKMYKAAVDERADIYHFHDPDFIKYGLKLIKLGKKVIYDVHEDYPLNILEKQWIPKIFRSLVSRWFKNKEIRAIRKFSGTISVTPQIVDRLKLINNNVELITNYPIIDKDVIQNKLDINSSSFCFAGTIEHLRRIDLLVEILSEVNLTFELAGAIELSFRKKLETLKGWDNVNYYGYIPYNKVVELYKKSLFGVMIEGYHSINYNDEGSLGVTKLFEFMMLGLPVICTDFKLHKEIIDRYHCGICVNPDSREDIKKAILFLSSNKEEAFLMGQRGQKAVLEIYNWESQEQKLINFYKNII